MILFRYIFKQVGAAALGAVGLFVFILITGNLLKDITRLLSQGRFQIGFFMELLMLLIPYVVAYALPLGFLSAILIVFGRLSAQSEIVAMKAAGVSLFRIASPVLVLATIGVGLCLFINLDYAPRARANYRERIAHAFTQDPLSFIQPQMLVHTFPGYILYTQRLDGQTLIDLNIWELNEKNEVTTFIQAEEGHFEYDPSKEFLILSLYKGMGEHRNQPDLSTLEQSEAAVALIFEHGSLKLPLSHFFKQAAIQKKLSHLSLSELLEKKAQLAEASDLQTADVRQKRISINLQIQKNIANACSVLALSIIAIPLGIRVSRKETYANLVLALGLALLYYLAMVILTWLEGFPHLRPDWLVWIPNWICLCVGGSLMAKMNRH